MDDFSTQDKKEFIFTLQIMGWNSIFPETTKQLAGKAMPNQAKLSEPQHDKTNKMAVRPAKTQISLGIRPSDQSLRGPHEERLGPQLPIKRTVKTLIRLEDSDQTGRMPGLIWVFAGCALIVLVLFLIVWHNFTSQNIPVSIDHCPRCLGDVLSKTCWKQILVK